MQLDGQVVISPRYDTTGNPQRSPVFQVDLFHAMAVVAEVEEVDIQQQ